MMGSEPSLVAKIHSRGIPAGKAQAGRKKEARWKGEAVRAETGGVRKRGGGLSFPSTSLYSSSFLHC